MQAPRLKRTLGIGLLTFYGLGNILGAGIYVLVGEVAGVAGTYAPLAFLLAAAVAALSAFSYGELAARHPVSAGEAVYMQEAFGWRGLSLATGLLIAAAGLTSAATLARGFAAYLQVLVPVPEAGAVSAVVIVLGLTAAWGVGESVRVAAGLTLVEMLGLLLVVAVVVVAFASGAEPEARRAPPPGIPWGGVVAGAFVAFFAFIGFEDMVNMAEEVKDPQRSMPRAILLALCIATGLYLLVTAAAVTWVDPQHLAGDAAPLARVYTAAGGSAPWLLALIGMAAVVNGVLVQLIMAARVLYGMSRQGWLPAGLGTVHARTRTPLVATAGVTAIALLLATLVELGGLARITSFLVLCIFVMVNAALLIMKRREPSPPGVQPTPGWLPGCALLSALALLAGAVAQTL
jgi:amino acid transporter